MAIIAVLVALLLPALNMARENARTITCSANLHQVGIAFAQYQLEYNNFYPVTFVYSDSDTEMGSDYSKFFTKWFHALRPYSGSYKIFNCPKMNMMSPQTEALDMSFYWGWPLPGRAYYGEICNYQYNRANFGGWPAPLNMTLTATTRYNTAKSEKFLERCGVPFSRAVVVKDGFAWFATPDTSASSWEQYYYPGHYVQPGPDAKGGTNVLFADWHVETVGFPRMAYRWDPSGLCPYFAFWVKP